MTVEIYGDTITAEISGDEITVQVIRYGPDDFNSFIGLNDTFNAYTGRSGQTLTVNDGESAVNSRKLVRPDVFTLTDGANITANIDSWLESRAKLEYTTRTAINLTLQNLVEGAIWNLSMTKNNTDQDLVFTLAGTNLVFDVFDSSNNVFTRATTVTISGTDTDQSWALIFDNTGILDGTDTIIQVTGTIDAFA